MFKLITPYSFHDRGLEHQRFILFTEKYKHIRVKQKTEVRPGKLKLRVLGTSGLDTKIYRTLPNIKIGICQVLN